MNLKSRVVEPVQGWQAWKMSQRYWGEHTPLIESWFCAGEELQHSELEIEVEEPDRWELARHWFRNLHLKPAYNGQV